MQLVTRWPKGDIGQCRSNGVYLGYYIAKDFVQGTLLYEPRNIFAGSIVFTSFDCFATVISAVICPNAHDYHLLLDMYVLCTCS